MQCVPPYVALISLQPCLPTSAPMGESSMTLAPLYNTAMSITSGSFVGISKLQEGGSVACS